MTTTKKVFDTIQSKQTYATAAGAERAGRRTKGEAFAKVEQLPSGRYCYSYVTYIGKP